MTVFINGKTTMMIRGFLPVGQGAFYCEQFTERLEGKRTTVIYDCGSHTNKKLVENQIQKHFKKGETIHAVFISHLDEDHINGLPFLLKYGRVERIFFPLITQANAKYLSLYNIIKHGRAEAFAASFLENPYSALEQLNLEYRPQLYQVIGSDQGYNGINTITIPSGQNTAGIIFGSTTVNCNLYKEWLYIPHNFEEVHRIMQLQDALKRVFGKNIDNEDLQTIWEKGTDQVREAIKGAYKAVKGSFNTNSMTVYSGMRNHWMHQDIVRSSYGMCGFCDHGKKNIGCLYMGIMMHPGRKNGGNYGMPMMSIGRILAVFKFRIMVQGITIMRNWQN